MIQRKRVSTFDINHMLYAMHDFVVEHIKAHRCQRHARHYVDRTEPKSCGGVLSKAGHQVPETDGGERHEAEINSIQHRPFF